MPRLEVYGANRAKLVNVILKAMSDYMYLWKYQIDYSNILRHGSGMWFGLDL